MPACIIAAASSAGVSVPHQAAASISSTTSEATPSAGRRGISVAAISTGSM